MKFTKILFLIYFFTTISTMILSNYKPKMKKKEPRKLIKLSPQQLMEAEVPLEKFTPLSLAFIGKYQMGVYNSHS